MQWIWIRFTTSLLALHCLPAAIPLSTTICTLTELLHMPGGIYFPARKIPKYWPRTCQDLNSVRLQAPNSHLSSLEVCKQSVTLPCQAWPDMHFQSMPSRSGSMQNSVRKMVVNLGGVMAREPTHHMWNWIDPLWVRGACLSYRSHIVAVGLSWRYSCWWGTCGAKWEEE